MTHLSYPLGRHWEGAKKRVETRLHVHYLGTGGLDVRWSRTKGTTPPVPIQYLHRPCGAEVINERIHHTVVRADWVLHAMSVRCKSGGRTQVRE